jgi:DNA-binding MarR family transcriptional regulator
MTGRSGRGAPRGAREEEAFVSLLRATDRLQRRIVELFKREDLSLTQYNVLRILRGAAPEALPTLEIAARMVESDPGITRLLDRLEAKRLVTRQRCPQDRRRVLCRITDAGQELLARLDGPVLRADESMFRTFSPAQLKRLVRLLDAVRSGNG